MSTGATIRVRRASAEEAQDLTELSMRAKQSNGYDGSFMRACRAELTITAVDLKDGEYWVAECDEICGVVSLADGKEPRAGEIHCFFVEPNWQRQGIGQLLWCKILQRAAEESFTKLGLDADPAAVPFYNILGFDVVAEVPSGSIEGRKIPRMELSL